MNPKNLILVGYRGAGKSSTGEVLAKRLGKTLISTDKLIEEKVSMVIAEYVRKHDWQTFRECEHEVLESIEDSDIVLDCGGGIIERADNRSCLRERGIVIYLISSIETIAKRIGGDAKRPALTRGKDHVEEIAEVLERRAPLYEEVADYILATDGKSPKRVADDIITLLKTKAHEKIVIPVGEDTIEKTQKKLQEARRRCRLVELRLDMIQDIDEEDLSALLTEDPQNTIVTCRLKSEGGVNELPEEKRIRLLEAAIENGAGFVDIENASGQETITRLIGKRADTQVICSYHDFESMPHELEDIYARLKETGADILKIACMGTAEEDNDKMLSLLSKANDEGILLCGIVMGNAGERSRILGPARGSRFTFASMGEKEATAPGQLGITTLRKKMGERLTS